MLKLLIVDDDALSRDSIARFLSDHTAHQIFSAKDGDEALALFEEHRFPIVVSDTRMPGMSGIELLSELKKREPRTEVIIMTGFGDDETAVEALNAGASRYLLKPIQIEDLMDEIEKIVKKH